MEINMKRVGLFLILLACLTQAHVAAVAPKAFVFVGPPMLASPATCYEKAGSTNVWTGTNNWASATGGTAGTCGATGGVPGATDTAIFDSNSGAMTVSAGTSVGTLCIETTASCASSSGAAYTGTLTRNANLTIAVALILNTSYTDAVTAFPFVINGTTVTITSHGRTFASPLAIAPSGTMTLTLGDNWTVSGALTIGGTAALTLTCTTANCTLTSAGAASLTATTSNQAPSNGASIVFGSGSTLSVTGYTTGSLSIPLTFNNSGVTVTGGSGIVRYKTGPLTISAGATLSNLLVNLTGVTEITTSATGVSVGALNAVATGLNTLDGTQAPSIGTLESLIPGASFQLQSGLTYPVTTALILTGSSASPITIAPSATTATIAYSGAQEALAWVNPTNILATGTVYDFCQPACTGSGTVTGWTFGTIIGGFATSGGGGHCTGCDDEAKSESTGGSKWIDLLLFEPDASNLLKATEWARREARQWIPKVWFITESNQFVLEELRPNCEPVSDSVPIFPPDQEPGGHDRFAPAIDGIHKLGRPMSPCLPQKLESGVALCCE